MACICLTNPSDFDCRTRTLRYISWSSTGTTAGTTPAKAR